MLFPSHRGSLLCSGNRGLLPLFASAFTVLLCLWLCSRLFILRSSPNSKDNLGLVLVSQQLIGDIYASWSRAKLIALSVKNKLRFIDGSIAKSEETLGGGNYLFALRMFMVLFRREFSFCDSLYLWEMMWALEYDPDIFSMYEEPESLNEKSEGSKGKVRLTHQFGKYERENMKNGAKGSESPLPISVFLVASVLKDKSGKLLQEARGLDDVVKILNDITGNLDAKKACSGAMKLHKKYLKKVKKP